MAEARADTSQIRLRFSQTCALFLAALTAACGSIGDPAGYALVTQDRYDFMTCKEIVGHRAGQAAREKQLTELIEKAETAPGGFILGAAAYRSELVQARALKAAAERAARMHNCDTQPKS
jgi:hypothetical protein